MTVKKLQPQSAESANQDLVKKLTEEWTSESEEVREPLILMDDKPQHPIHIYVIWNDWRELGMQERSRIIMEAYQEVAEPEDFTRVSVAMGLTKEEAPRFNIDLSRYV